MHDRILSASEFTPERNFSRLVSSLATLFFFFCSVAALLAEAERLGQERVDVQRQAEKDRVGLAGRLRSLELALEEHESRTQQQEEQHRTQTEDLQQNISALEKQLKHHRHFIDVSKRLTTIIVPAQVVTIATCMFKYCPRCC